MMLDIMANNNWKRPIYFSPGSFGDDDYQWMKDYLELKVVFTNWFLRKTNIRKKP
jgi:hypothetical protein